MLPETALELPREHTRSTIVTVFCDGEVRKLTFHRRKFGLRFYAIRIGQALRGEGDPVRQNQHPVLITLVEKDSNTDRIVRTINSNKIECPHTCG